MYFSKNVLVAIALTAGGFAITGCGSISCDDGVTAIATPYKVPTVVCDGGATCQVIVRQPPATNYYEIICDPAQVAGTTCSIGGEHCFGPKHPPAIDSFTWSKAKPAMVAGTTANDQYGLSCCVDLKVTFSK